jgi:cobalt/nickel transport system permease protein
MNLLMIDKFSEIDSPVHQLDPLIKLLSFLAFVVVVVLLPSGSFVPLAVALITLACVTLVSQLPLGFVLRRTLVVLPFVLLIGAVNLMGRGLDSLISSVTMAAKSVISVLGFTLLLSTTGSARLLAATRRMGLPAIMPVATGFMLRYVFVLADELSRLKRSWEARRVGRLRWFAELRYIGSLVGVLLIRSYERAERVYLAMCSRGFDGFLPVRQRDPISAKSAIFAVLLIGPLLVAAVLCR